MRSDHDYNEEIRGHIEMETQANIERGMSPGEAARAARITFGSLEGTRQRLREGRRGYWLRTLTEDFRYAFRAIRRNLQLSCAVVLTLSVGIGLTTAVFSLINSLAFHPPVSRDPASFVMALNNTRYGGQRRVASVPGYERIRAQTQSLQELAAWSGSFRLSAAMGFGDTSKVDGWLTSCNFFSVFNDEQPRLGRFFQEEDCASRLPVIVISERLWRQRFSGDPEIIGKSVSYSGKTLTIIGVAIPPKLVDEEVPSLWVPYTNQPLLKDATYFPKRNWLQDDSFHWLQLAGRLRPGYSRLAAEEELKILVGREKPVDPSGNFGIRLTDGSIWGIFPDDVLYLLAVALVFPTLVMVIVCATVATLLLSRALARQREMAVRLALGGARARLLQMLLAETFVLSSAAAAVSLVFVLKAPDALMSFLVMTNAPTMTVTPDWRVFLYLASLTILTAVLSGLTPALQSLRTQLGESLKGREIFVGHRGRSRVRQALVGIQVAFCLILMISAVALLRAERRRANPGFETRQVLSAEIPQSVALDAKAQTSLVAAIRSVPEVRSVALSNSVPALFETEIILDVPGRPRETVPAADVSAEYFDTFRIPVLSGRTFTETEGTADDEPAVISERLAERAFPQLSPLGQVVRIADAAQPDRRVRIVGVAKNRIVAGGRNTRDDGTFIYLRMKPRSDAYLFVRFEGDAIPAARSLQALLKAQTGSVLPVATIQSRLEGRMAVLRRLEILLLAMGGIGLGLALVGVYGVVSFEATQRKRDFAIRTALGADRSTIFKAVMLAGLKPIPIAVVAGIGLSFGVLKVIGAQGFLPMLGLTPNDPIPHIAAVVVLLLAILGALVLPTRRAVASDFAKTLRDE
jgi:predicted permease